MLEMFTPAFSEPGTEVPRRSEVERVISRFRSVAGLPIITVEVARWSKPYYEWSLVAAAVFFLSCFISVMCLRRELSLRQLHLLAVVLTVVDLSVFAVMLLVDTNGGYLGIWSAGVLIVVESSVRWTVLGGIVSAAGASVTTAGWMAHESVTYDVPFSWRAFLFRSSIFLVTSFGVGGIVRGLDKAWNLVARRLAEAEVVNRFALAAPEMTQLQAAELMAQMVHDDLGFERVTVLLHDSSHDRLIPVAWEGYTNEPDPLPSDGPVYRGGFDRISTSVSARSFVRNQPVISRVQDGREQFGPTISGEPFVQTKLAAPLRTPDGSLGVIVVSSTRRNAFGDHDAVLLGSMAAELAQALEHSRVMALRAETIADLQRISEVKDEFIAVASHELRTPITALRGFARALVSPQVTPEQSRHAVEVINRQVDRLSLLIEDLLAVSLIDSGRSTPALELIELRSIAQEVVSDAAMAATGHTFRLTVPDELACVSADPGFVRRVLLNLVANAVKYSPDGGPVDIEATAVDDADRVLVCVRDRGIGIPHDEQARIFEKFMRASGEGAVGGTGLGLYIVKGLIEAMGGTVTVDSQPGVGSTFSFTLALPPGPTVPGSE